MNRGLLLQTVREVWPITALFGLAIAGVETLLAYILPTLVRDYAELSEQWLQLSFVQGIFRGLLGAEISNGLELGAIASVAWVHPAVLAILWAHEITVCTRMPAGEVDRGTIDVLLGLPISRTHVYMCVSVVWLGSGACVILMGLAGNMVGGWLAGPEGRGAPTQLAAVVVNFCCVYVAVGGAACLVSSLSDRRGRAVGIVFAIVLTSFFLNFLAQLWEPAKSLAFLSVLHYHRPLHVLYGSSWPVTDMLVLATVGAALWLAGAVVFARRDICTV